MKTIRVLGLLGAVGVASGVGFVYSGVYSIGADEPHWPATLNLVEMLRERSIAMRSRSIKVPAGPKRSETRPARCSMVWRWPRPRQGL